METFWEVEGKIVLALPVALFLWMCYLGLYVGSGGWKKIDLSDLFEWAVHSFIYSRNIYSASPVCRAPL